MTMPYPHYHFDISQVEKLRRNGRLSDNRHCEAFVALNCFANTRNDDLDGQLANLPAFIHLQDRSHGYSQHPLARALSLICYLLSESPT
jgi:muconolactone delta-isomerase